MNLPFSDERGPRKREVRLRFIETGDGLLAQFNLPYLGTCLLGVSRSRCAHFTAVNVDRIGGTLVACTGEDNVFYSHHFSLESLGDSLIIQVEQYGQKKRPTLQEREEGIHYGVQNPMCYPV